MKVRRSSVIRKVLVVATASVCVAGAISFSQNASLQREKEACRSQMERLGESMRNYRDTFGCFPPAILVNSNGEPMHSWRVLIVPFLESNRLYDAYKFDEPGNGTNNRQLLRERLEQGIDGTSFDITLVRELYQCPGASRSQSPYATNYVMVVNSNEPTRRFAARRGHIHGREEWQARYPVGGEIMVVEIHNCNVHWMEPRDLTLAEMSFVVNGTKKPSISSPHLGGAFVLKADGTVEFLTDETTEARLREMLEPTK